MAKILYRPCVVKGQSFKGAKVHTVPSQSLTLADILKRFVRREPLPVSHDAMYETRFGDLEKIQHEDIVDKRERAEEIRQTISKAKKRMKDAEDARVKAEIERQAKEKAEQAARAMAEKTKADSAASSGV